MLPASSPHVSSALSIPRKGVERAPIIRKSSNLGRRKLPLAITPALTRAMKQRYDEQRHRANQRDVEWDISFADWRDLWLEDDRWLRRGTGPDELVMSRPGDVGPYALSNVRIITQRANAQEYAERAREAALA